MAKRVRGSQSTHRPGGTAPARPAKPTTAAAASSATGSATWDTGIDAAIDAVVMESTEVTLGEPVAAPASTAKVRRRVAPRTDSLQARVDAENVYVLADLKRIAVVTGVLLVTLAVAWVLFVALDLLGLY